MRSLGRINRGKSYAIDVGGNKPIKHRHLSVPRLLQLYREIDRTKALGVMEKLGSTCSSQVTLVEIDKVRLWLFARKGKRITMKDVYPSSLIERI